MASAQNNSDAIEAYLRWHVLVPFDSQQIFTSKPFGGRLLPKERRAVSSPHQEIRPGEGTSACPGACVFWSFSTEFSHFWRGCLVCQMRAATAVLDPGKATTFFRCWVPCALPPVSRATALRLHMGPPATRPLCPCVQPVQPLKPEKADDRKAAHPPALRPPSVWGATALRRPSVGAAACVPLQPPWTGSPARRRPVPALPTRAGLPDRHGAASAPGNPGKPVAGSARLLRPPALPWGAARPSARLPARPATAEPRGDV
ncbi:formin-like protein 5 isoform X4 [Meles meles]|uniref:formin-like protein 5 isoform X4 n=1 Tax=Meles meles TaxID=9662 RepID=UPI001E69A9A5|nr:formin-like protein 5 isoform X4 [Meles meles]